MRPAPRLALLRALVWAGVVVGVYWSAVRTTSGQRFDDRLEERLRDETSVVVAQVVRPGVLVLLGLVVAGLCVVAWRAGRQRLVLVVGVALLVTVVVSPLLRDVLLVRPDLAGDGDVRNSLPSTHMAFGTALALGVVRLRSCAPSRGTDRGVRGRPGGVAGLGLSDAGTRAALAVALVVEAVSNVMAFAHRPSDTVAGVAVAAASWSVVWAAAGRWVVDGAAGTVVGTSGAAPGSRPAP